MNVYPFRSLLELMERVMFSILRGLDVEGLVNEISACERNVSLKSIVVSVTYTMYSSTVQTPLRNV